MQVRTRAPICAHGGLFSCELAHLGRHLPFSCGNSRRLVGFDPNRGSDFSASSSYASLSPPSPLSQLQTCARTRCRARDPKRRWAQNASASRARSESALHRPKTLNPPSHAGLSWSTIHGFPSSNSHRLLAKDAEIVWTMATPSCSFRASISCMKFPPTFLYWAHR